MEDRYKDLFNDPNLGNEDWLEPGPEVLGSIKAELYPEKKDRRYLIIFFILGVITILFSSLFLLSKEDKSIGELNDSQTQSSISHDSNNEDLKIKNTISKKELKAEQSTSNSSEVISSIKQKNQIISDSSTKENKVDKASSKKGLSQHSNTTPVLSSSLERLKGKNLPAKEKSVIENNLSQGFKTEVKDNNAFIELLPLIKAIPSKGISFTSDKEKVIATPSGLDFINTNFENRKAWGLCAEAGYLTTRFILNSNYLSALDPADFTQEPGSGQYVELSFYKELNSRLSLSIGANYGRTVFNSGHNSAVVYNLQDESTDQEINYDMPMATPIGFISSQIVIQRATDSAEEETELIVDLQNKHTLNILDVTAGANYKVIDRSKFNLNVFSGYGLSYLIDIKNEFRSFTPSDNGFISGDSQITSDQQNINSLTPVLDLGLNLNYEIRKGARIGLSYKFKTNLNPIFEMDDFNSSMNRNHYGINFKLDLN